MLDPKAFATWLEKQAADECGENCLTCGRCLTDDAETPQREE